MDSSRKTYIKNSLFMLLFFDFLLSIFAPLEFYITNKAYFFFSGIEMIPFAILLFIAVMVAGAILIFLLSKTDLKISTLLTCTVTGIVFALYIIGNFMVVDYGAMDGLVPRWERFQKEGILQSAVFIIIPLVSLVVSLIIKNKEKVLKAYGGLSVCLLLVLILTLVSILITTGLKKDPEYIVTADHEFELSKDQNVIVFIIDTYDSKIFDDMLMEDHDKYADLLKDFTYYPDTTSMFAATELALPQIITGVSYHNEVPYGEYLKKAFYDSKMLEYLRANDYSTGIYTCCRMPQDEMALQFENVRYMERTVSSHRRLAGYMYKFLGFRYMPQPLKKYFWFYPDEMRSELESTKDDSVEVFYDNNYLFDSKIDDMSYMHEGKVFRLYHIDGVHAPFSISSDFSPSSTETSIEEEGRGIMYVVDHLLGSLKEKGIYDNSAIVIMADHGYFDERSNPLMLMKGIGEDHPFEVSDKMLSYEYLQDVMMSLCESNTSLEAVKQDKSEQAGRKYLYYAWNKDLKDYAYASTITEFDVKGNARDIDGYKKIREYHGEE